MLAWHSKEEFNMQCLSVKTTSQQMVLVIQHHNLQRAVVLGEREEEKKVIEALEAMISFDDALFLLILDFNSAEQ